jgi:cell division protein FtsB
MKVLAAALVMLLALLQYRLWLGEGGLREVRRLRGEIEAQRVENQQLKERNRTLSAEVLDLKKGTVAIEERARTDLGMVGKGETFYQVVPPSAAVAPAPARPAPAPEPDDDGRVIEARAPTRSTQR